MVIAVFYLQAPANNPCGYCCLHSFKPEAILALAAEESLLTKVVTLVVTVKSKVFLYTPGGRFVNMEVARMLRVLSSFTDEQIRERHAKLLVEYDDVFLESRAEFVSLNQDFMNGDGISCEREGDQTMTKWFQANFKRIRDVMGSMKQEILEQKDLLAAKDDQIQALAAGDPDFQLLNEKLEVETREKRRLRNLAEAMLRVPQAQEDRNSRGSGGQEVRSARTRSTNLDRAVGSHKRKRVHTSQSSTSRHIRRGRRPDRPYPAGHLPEDLGLEASESLSSSDHENEMLLRGVSQELEIAEESQAEGTGETAESSKGKGRQLSAQTVARATSQIRTPIEISITLLRRPHPLSNVPIFMAAELRDLIKKWDAHKNMRALEWELSSKVTGRAQVCLNNKMSKIKTTFKAVGEDQDPHGWSCEQCTKNGTLCVLVKRSGFLTVLPLHAEDAEEGATWNERGFWAHS